MAARIVPRASDHEILMFLKSRGVALSDEAVRILKERLREEPVGKPTLERSKLLVRNRVFKDVLDRAFVRRSVKIQKIADSNPFLRIMEQKKRALERTGSAEPPPMPEPLRKVFFDEPRWQPFMPFLGIPSGGRIVKIAEAARPDKPYIGYLKKEGTEVRLYTTRRSIPLDDLGEAKFFRLKDGLFQYEIDEKKDIERRYCEYIMSIH